jgi:catechol 2,3-dioxygenase-like lactoylglutathione lyase family enzyme
MRIDRLRLRSPDPARLLAFYRRAFDVTPTALGFALGEEQVEIAACETTDHAVFASNESGFQHFAMVVDDIDAAYQRLVAAPGWWPISLAGPERLPRASGRAAAFKFRDPDGHPLELLHFPSDATPAVWRARFAAAPERRFHGVDHTGLSVGDSAASAAFFVGLGFAAADPHINAGPEQARLDGFADLLDATVSITSLSPAGGARPGVELLGYRDPPPCSRPARDGSAAATEIVLAEPTGAAPLRDPDGHRLAVR